MHDLEMSRKGSLSCNVCIRLSLPVQAPLRRRFLTCATTSPNCGKWTRSGTYSSDLTFFRPVDAIVYSNSPKEAWINALNVVSLGFLSLYAWYLLVHFYGWCPGHAAVEVGVHRLVGSHRGITIEVIYRALLDLEPRL